MIVAMLEKATDEQIDAVIEALTEAGVEVHRTTGEMQTILAAVGQTSSLELAKFEIMPGVMHVHRISSPYKLAGRSFRPEGTVIEFRNGVTVGGKQVVAMGGPCSVETRDQMFETARRVRGAGGTFLRGGAFKPRSSPYSFQGLGVPGLELMREAADAHGLLVVSEVMEIAQIEIMLPYVDLLQVGARNMQNYNLLRELGLIRKPILLKRGIAATVEELLLSSEYILSGGNYDVILCERGIRTYETYTRNTMDISAIPIVKKLSHLPIVGDPSHGTGRRDMVAPLARAAVAAGADGVIVEVHPNADKAASDAAQTLYPDQFDTLMGELRLIARAVGRTL
ncbi:MAG TPA: 3-deoxy-7-phosphoheptulonate synthase [Terracidiphilus sp.]|jgi:3-deoxy-7-phosphoheptulonate synthase|nr:3-deoxy-7-phosphoheptulonate synthase [Terracidiphilus sp.]